MNPRDTGQRADIRLLLTNDIFGAFFPRPVSWGTQPGGVALACTIDMLREDAHASAWIDGGDFSAGGPLAPATDGELGWAAAAELGIDAATPGNHEFDFGDDVMADHARSLPFPLVASDLVCASDWVIPHSVSPIRDHLIISSPHGHSVGIIGLCLPERRGLRVYHQTTDLVSAATRTVELAKDLRPDVDHVVVVMHEGFGLYPGLAAHSDHDAVTRIEAIRTYCEQVRGHVDAAVGGHTLGRYVGHFHGIPFVQPWALGVEVGILDFDTGGVTVRSQPVSPALSAPWTGSGADLEAKLRAMVVGILDRPIFTSARHTRSQSLTQVVAEGLLAGCETDFAIVHPDDTSTQVGVDGILGYLPAGPVTEADIMCAVPWAGTPHADAVLAADLALADVDTIVAGFGALGLPVGCAQRQPNLTGGSVALVSRYTPLANNLLGRDVEWSHTGGSLRDGLRLAVAR